MTKTKQKPPSINYPKVLIAAPQHISKMYCFKKWIERVASLTYPNFDVYINDNSPDDKNTQLINSFNGRLGINIKCEHLENGHPNVVVRKNDSHIKCFEYAKENGYDYLFHLETDVFPPLDVIERLLLHNKMVACGFYDILFGSKRKAMVQLCEEYDITVRAYNCVPWIEHDEPRFFDGTLKEVYHAGLGCALIHMSVLDIVKFRVNEGVNIHTDTYFANDCRNNSIPIFLDTTIQCKHDNQTWLGLVGKKEGAV